MAHPFLVVRSPFGLHISPADLSGCVPVAVLHRNRSPKRPWLSRLGWRPPCPLEEAAGGGCTADIGRSGQGSGSAAEIQRLTF